MTHTTVPKEILKFIESNSLPMAIASLKFDILAINEGGAQILGKNKHDIIGKNLSHFTLIGDVSYNFDYYEKLLKGEVDSYSFTRKFKSLDGRVNEGMIISSLIKHEEGNFLLGCFQINESYNSAIRTSSSVEMNTLSQVLSLNPDIHYIYDKESQTILYQNMEFLGYLGYEKSDLNGELVLNFLRKKIDNDSIYKKQVRRNRVNEGNYRESEYRIQAKNGEWRWINSRHTNLVNMNEDLKLTYVIIKDFTESKLIKDEIEYQYHFIDQIAQILPDVIFVFDPYSMESVYSNLKDKTFISYTEEEWLTPGNIVPDPEYAKSLSQDIRNFIEQDNEEVVSYEYRYTDKEGNKRWVQYKCKVFSRDENGKIEYCLSLATEVTQSKEANEAIRKAKQENESIIKALPDLILVMDKDARYISYSSADEDVEKQVKQQLHGKKASEVLKPKDAARIEKYIEECLTTNKLQAFEMEYETSDGVTFFISMRMTKLDDERVLVLTRDITQNKITENEIQNKIRQLSEKNNELERFIKKNTELERFAYIISHDLKEPLRSISSISQIVGNEISNLNNAKLNMLIDHLKDASERMNTMIDGVLDYSRLETNQFAFGKVDLDETLKHIISDFDRLISEKSIKVDVKELPEVYGSEVQLRQLFQNLINNAIKFNEAEQPILKIYTERDKENNTVFCIYDNGIGIEERFKETIFKMFRKLNSVQRFNGQGIGLSICKKIVETHNGDIWVEDNPTGGSIFKFTLNAGK